MNCACFGEEGYCVYYDMPCVSVPKDWDMCIAKGNSEKLNLIPYLKMFGIDWID
jgi:hypothetical protein